MPASCHSVVENAGAGGHRRSTQPAVSGPTLPLSKVKGIYHTTSPPGASSMKLRAQRAALLDLQVHQPTDVRRGPRAAVQHVSEPVRPTTTRSGTPQATRCSPGWAASSPTLSPITGGLPARRRRVLRAARARPELRRRCPRSRRRRARARRGEDFAISRLIRRGAAPARGRRTPTTRCSSPTSACTRRSTADPPARATARDVLMRIMQAKQPSLHDHSSEVAELACALAAASG